MVVASILVFLPLQYHGKKFAFISLTDEPKKVRYLFSWLFFRFIKKLDRKELRK